MQREAGWKLRESIREQEIESVERGVQRLRVYGGVRIGHQLPVNAQTEQHLLIKRAGHPHNFTHMLALTGNTGEGVDSIPVDQFRDIDIETVQLYAPIALELD